MQELLLLNVNTGISRIHAEAECLKTGPRPPNLSDDESNGWLRAFESLTELLDPDRECKRIARLPVTLELILPRRTSQKSKNQASVDC